ncbi:MAG: hypothetical protein IPL26_08315 [Leptospiraceae bacterium]|nr:hypothetical protein [Leptospiraceae bacterium]
MLSRIYTLIFIFTTVSVFAQAPAGNTANSSTGKAPHAASKDDTSIPKGNYLNSVNQNLTTLEKGIVEKIATLEKLQARAAELNSNLKQKVTINDEVPNLVKRGGSDIVTSRHIEFTFEGEKAKELKVVSKKKNLSNDLHSVVRTLTFTPVNLESIKIKVVRFDSVTKGVSEIEDYNSMPLEAKIVALKAIDLVLYNTIFRFDTLIQRAEVSKLENTRNNLTEL